jgi:cobalt-zinc-cadmium efflux system protein
MSRSRRLGAALAVNAVLVVAEVAGGVDAHSTGLLSDAGHSLADVGSVVLSLAALRWSLRPRTELRTFGNHRGTILAALANATLLAVITLAILALSLYRLFHPVAVHGAVVGVVAGAALVLNGAAALALRDRTADLNMRSTALHMTADAAASAAVLVAGIIVATAGPGADRADPAAALLVGLLVLVQAIRVMRESADVLLESAPADVDVGVLRQALGAVPGIDDVHDLHVWSLSSDYRALSAHLVLSGHPSLEDAQRVGSAVRDRLARRFGIAHSTLEMECERCDDELPDPCASDELTEPRSPAPPAPGRRHLADATGAQTRRNPE